MMKRRTFYCHAFFKLLRFLRTSDPCARPTNANFQPQRRLNSREHCYLCSTARWTQGRLVTGPATRVHDSVTRSYC